MNNDVYEKLELAVRALLMAADTLRICVDWGIDDVQLDILDKFDVPPYTDDGWVFVSDIEGKLREIAAKCGAGDESE